MLFAQVLDWPMLLWSKLPGGVRGPVHLGLPRPCTRGRDRTCNAVLFGVLLVRKSLPPDANRRRLEEPPHLFLYSHLFSVSYRYPARCACVYTSCFCRRRTSCL